ncbi:amino acid adenylation domain-containing protein [Nonomuraea sp. NPDC052265]|uniref:amino acid adenylation domain-containing protein n=1 Tax=Nonomuraea sp. NPDC052265 TaxID=3364374 RepID=UPI0037C4FA77
MTVPWADLSAGLRTLAAAAGADESVVLLAAHLKVLSMLAGGPVVRTGVDLRGGPSASLVAHVSAATWSGLVGHAKRRLAAAEPALGEARDEARFVVGVSAPAEHGLAVAVQGSELTVSATSSAVPVESMAEMFRAVLTSMASSIDGDARASFLPDVERRLVLADWARGPRTAREPVTVLDLIQRQVARTPAAVAVRVGTQTLTYGELDRLSDRIARRILDEEVPDDVPVGVCMRRHADLLPTLIGVWKAGAAYLPLDPDLPVQRLSRMTAMAGCSLVVSHSEHLDTVTALGRAKALLLDQDMAAAGAEAGAGRRSRLRPHDVAYVIFTSGSTGLPKGVMVEHRGLANYLLWTARAYAACGEGGSPYFTSLGFDLGMPSLFTPLMVGQAVHLLPDPLDPADLGAVLVEGGPYSFIKMTPGHLNLISLDLSSDQAAKLAGVVIAAGDAFPASLAVRWHELSGPDGTAVATEYGPTEITVGNSGARITPGRSRDGLLPLGEPIPNTTVYVLTEWLEPVAPGVVAEVYVGGAGVARGYLGDPALTAERFVPDPYGAPGSRLYRTGDRAGWRKGELEFFGRTDHQLKIRGHRIELAEVGAALQRHPGVRDAIVVDRHHGSRVDLVGFVVPVAGHTVDPAGLLSLIAEDLPGYMIPSVIRSIDEFPLTANGKVDHRALRHLLHEDAPPPLAPGQEEMDEAEETAYDVVINDEEQFSLWAAGRPVPAGWQSAGYSGSRDECLRHIAAVWTDMRPRSARRHVVTDIPE